MQTWIDTASGNLANANDTVTPDQPAYLAQTPVFTPVAPTDYSSTGDGVAVTGIALGSGTATDGSGSGVTGTGATDTTSISMSGQFIQLMEAQNSFAADSSALGKAVSAYQAGLTIGS